MEFAGHPTVGTACALVSNGHVADRELVFEEGIGPIKVSVSDHSGGLAATLTTTTPLISTEVRPRVSELASVLSVDSAQVTDRYFASLGVDFCLAQLASPDIVDAAIIDPVAWQQFARDAWSSNMFFYSGNPVDGETLCARMSAPVHDISEDPATGSAVFSTCRMDRHPSQTSSECRGRPRGGDGATERDRSNRSRRRTWQLQSVAVGGPTRMCASGQIDIDESLLDRP